MIRVNELRIGSWVLEDGEPIKVFAIEYGVEPYCRINETVVSKKDIVEIFEPILITSEFLQSVGFVSLNNEDNLSLLLPFDQTIHYSNQNKSFQFNENVLPKSPAFVHQFQNMYLFLIGEELEIKL